MTFELNQAFTRKRQMGSVLVHTAIGNIPDFVFGIFSIPHQPSCFPLSHFRASLISRPMEKPCTGRITGRIPCRQSPLANCLTDWSLRFWPPGSEARRRCEHHAQRDQREHKRAVDHDRRKGCRNDCRGPRHEIDTVSLGSVPPISLAHFNVTSNLPNGRQRRSLRPIQRS
jgi:hypothetical protein